MGHICTSSVGVCEDLSLVIGLNLKRGGGVGPAKNQHCLERRLSQRAPF